MKAKQALTSGFLLKKQLAAKRLVNEVVNINQFIGTKQGINQLITNKPRLLTN